MKIMMSAILITMCLISLVIGLTDFDYKYGYYLNSPNGFHYDFVNLRHIDIFGYTILIGRHIPSNWKVPDSKAIQIYTWDSEEYSNLFWDTVKSYHIKNMDKTPGW